MLPILMVNSDNEETEEEILGDTRVKRPRLEE
jgi:hypothetical protein